MPIMAIDQGTTSTRAIIFNDDGMPLASDQIEHEQIFPRAGMGGTRPDGDLATLARSWARRSRNPTSSSRLAGGGDHQQRETTVVWNKTTGLPVYNAIVWQTPAPRRSATNCADGRRAVLPRDHGLLPATYFSGPKVRWILDNVPGTRAQAEAGELLMGTIDTGSCGTSPMVRVHATDPTNASCTLLMDLDTLSGPRSSRRPSGSHDDAAPYPQLLRGVRARAEPGVDARCPHRGILGDQQAATFGQACLSPGEAKNTYGTGNFLLLNTGRRRFSRTVC